MKLKNAGLLISTMVTVTTILLTGNLQGEMSIEIVSKERAQELGIEVRATANGPNEAWVEMEFRAAGELEKFSHVSLEIRDGDKLLLGYSSLQTKKTSSGSLVVGFLVNREDLQHVTLSVVEGFPTNYTGHELPLRDFVDLENLR